MSVMKVMGVVMVMAIQVMGVVILMAIQVMGGPGW